MSRVSLQTIARGWVDQVHEGSRNFPFVSEKPPQPPEGKLISGAMRRLGLSARAASTAAGISDTRWRHIVAGYQPVGDMFVPVHGPAETVARMARAVGVSSDALRESGRGDAADELAEMEKDARPVGSGVDPQELVVTRQELEEAIELAVNTILAKRASRGETDRGGTG